MHWKLRILALSTTKTTSICVEMLYMSSLTQTIVSALRSAPSPPHRTSTAQLCSRRISFQRAYTRSITLICICLYIYWIQSDMAFLSAFAEAPTAIATTESAGYVAGTPNVDTSWICMPIAPCASCI